MDRKVKGTRAGRDRGTRNTPGADARMSDHRESWIDLPKHSMILFVSHDEDWLKWKAEQGDPVENFDPQFPPVRIEIRQPGRRYHTVISLTGLTAEELKTFKEFIDRAYEKALPVCEEFDRKAQEAFDNGDTGYARLYRPVPKLYVRERLLAEHRASLQSGPEGPTEGGDEPDNSTTD